MFTVIITLKPKVYPMYDTYTAYEFLTLNAEYMRNIETVLIDQRLNNKKLRKVRRRMAAFNIVEIDMLPEDVLDVAESNVVHLPHSDIFIDLKRPDKWEGQPLEEIRRVMLEVLKKQAADTLKKTGYNPKLMFFDSMRSTMDHVNGQKQLDDELLKGLHDIGFDARLPLDRLLQDFGNMTVGDLKKRIETYFQLPRQSGKSLRDSAEELKNELSVKRPGMFRASVPNTMIHRHGFTAGKERTLKVKPWLENPQVVQLFKSKQELADYLVSKLPKGTELRKRNALKFKICVEMKEIDVLDLAGDPQRQVALVNKYC